MPDNVGERAATWDDDPGTLECARAAADAIRAAVAPERSTRLLEYGAGTGLTSQGLAGDVGPITLAEPSAGMRAVLADKLAAGTLPPGSWIWDLDLTVDDAPHEQFDLIVTVMTMHHIRDLATVLSAFARLLADGGDLCVVDLEEEDGTFHADNLDFDGHHGFARTALTRELEAAGFTDVRFEPCFDIVEEHRSYPLFLATATAGMSPVREPGATAVRPQRTSGGWRG